MEGHFANDVTVDKQNNIYVTDSFSPHIYKIDAQGQKEIFVTSYLWDINQGEFGLNGIVYHTEGFLIVSHYAQAKLYKVSLDDSKEVTEILFNQDNLSTEEKLSQLDGLELSGNTLSVVSNNLSASTHGNAVYQMTSSDTWKTATITGTMLTGQTSPTAVTTVGSNQYVLYADLLKLVSQQTAPKTYTLQKVRY
ncbi:MAG: hypothetical protein Q9M36_10340 [Sulfurovum sp.]|nr:hypothetical protein [Sulfurovum sp.]